MVGRRPPHARAAPAHSGRGERIVVFKKLLASMGAGGASVETVLHNPNVVPGGTVSGQVHLVGGTIEQEIERVAVGLTARVEVDRDDYEAHKNMDFWKQPLTGRFMLHPGQRHDLQFQMTVPWETPPTTFFGQHVRGMAIGVETELEIARSVDKGDLDPINVHPLPAQERILNAFLQLGFRFSKADLERGRIAHSNQQLPFYQEIEFWPAPQYARGMNQLEVTFITGPTAMEVVLEVDKRGGLLSEGRDTYNRFVVDFSNFQQVDWEGHLHNVLAQMSQRRGIF
jgi:sporulation-control protein